MAKQKKIKFIAEIECPHCQKPIKVFKEEKILTPYQKAEKEEKYYGEKSQQVPLHQFDQPPVAPAATAPMPAAT